MHINGKHLMSRQRICNNNVKFITLLLFFLHFQVRLSIFQLQWPQILGQLWMQILRKVVKKEDGMAGDRVKKLQVEIVDFLMVLLQIQFIHKIHPLAAQVWLLLNPLQLVELKTFRIYMHLLLHKRAYLLKCWTIWTLSRLSTMWTTYTGIVSCLFTWVK